MKAIWAAANASLLGPASVRVDSAQGAQVAAELASTKSELKTIRTGRVPDGSLAWAFLTVATTRGAAPSKEARWFAVFGPASHHPPATPTAARWTLLSLHRSM